MEPTQLKLPSSQQLTPSVMTIAGSDSGGEAGIQADLQTFIDFNTHGLSAVTANTAQNPESFISINAVSKQALTDQIQTNINFFNPQFIKTGLIYGTDQLLAIANSLDKQTVICDPILKSTTGARFSSPDTLTFYKEVFFRKINVLTPNWHELSWLTEEEIKSTTDAFAAAQKLSKKYCLDLYLKGGHGPSPNIDFLFQQNKIYYYESPILEIKSSHGTGCRISSAICAALAHGHSLPKACLLAKNYVYHALSESKLSNNKWILTSPGNTSTLPQMVTYKEINHD